MLETKYALFSTYNNEETVNAKILINNTNNWDVRQFFLEIHSLKILFTSY